MILFLIKIVLFIFSLVLMRYGLQSSIKIITKLGGFFIKFGQFLSTRPDIVSFKISQNLLKLQYNVGFDNTININEYIQGSLLEEIDLLSVIPIKSASIAQIYKAKLKNGNIIAIKIVKPTQRVSIINDLRNFERITNLISSFRKFQRLNIGKIMKNIKSAMLEELDLENEIRNITEFRCRFADYKNISAPKIYHKYSNNSIIVMEFIDGLTLGEIIESDINEAERQKVAKILLDSHLIQVYMHHKFHADIHHSNVIYGNNGTLYFIDFGIYSKINEKDSNAVLAIIRAFLNKDYIEIANIHQKVGYVPNNINLEDFVDSCKRIGDLYLGNEDFSVGEIFKSLMEVSSKFKMEIQPQLVLLQKTMIMTEGVIKSLYLNANIWEMSAKTINRIYLELAINQFFDELKSIRNLRNVLELITTIPSICKKLLSL